ncbi:MAG TPA: DUF4097 family beta strand repeat-containing protein [Acidimicrobiales bacterium]|nr:DUF4097 family beta strand repeat-containing protein [Acidimicrobiales bacterium]
MERAVCRDDGRQVIDLDDLNEVHVGLVGGDLLVSGTPGPSRLEIECVDGQPVWISCHDGLLLIEQHQPADLASRRTRATVAVSCPPATLVSARSVSAPVVVAGIAGELRATTVSGDIVWSYVGGEVAARSVSGRVEMEGVSGRLRVTTVSGDIALAGGYLDSLAAQSTSGNLTLDIETRQEGDYRCNTVSGHVLMRLPSEADATIEASSLSGRLAVPAAAEGERTGRPGRRRARSVLGSGSAAIRLRSVSGALAVLTRQEAVAV